MKKILLLLSMSLLIVLFINPETSKADNEKNTYIVGFNNGVNEKFINKYGGTIKKRYKYMSAISVKLNDESAKKIAENPNISYVEKDDKVHIMGQEVSWGFLHVNAFDNDIDLNSRYGSGVKIGLIDTGIDYYHEDLNVVGGESFIDGTTSYMDDNGHGSHVAGIISSLDNEVGVLGVASEADLYAIKVLDENGDGNHSDLIEGIEWAISNDMDIINMSLGSDTNSKALKEIIDRAYSEGILIIASAGNAGYNKKGSITYPAKYSSVISVGAINEDNNIAEFSSVGRELELVAPGVGIISTVPGGYSFSNGTSMSAPYVTGAAALLMSSKSDLSNTEIREILNQTAVSLGDSFMYGNGLIDIKGAVNYIGTSNQLAASRK